LLFFKNVSFILRGYDFANFSCEMMFNYNYDKHPYFLYDYNNYPNEEMQRKLINSYLSVLTESKDLNYPLPSEEKLLIETNTLALASHLSWSLWSIASAVNSQLEFDYLVMKKYSINL
jgi:hypothetical protein